MLIYVAGPYRAETNWEIQQNCRRAEEASLEIMRAGHLPMTPHAIGRNFFGAVDEHKLMDNLLIWLSRCDAAIFLPGYQDSAGPMAELNYCCRDDGIPFVVANDTHRDAAHFARDAVQTLECCVPSDYFEVAKRLKTRAAEQRDYVRRQDNWVETNNVKNGDLVRILRIAKDDEMGWDNVWEYKMSDSVGQTLRIDDADIDAGDLFESGIVLSDGYQYPFFVLEVVR